MKPMSLKALALQNIKRKLDRKPEETNRKLLTLKKFPEVSNCCGEPNKGWKVIPDFEHFTAGHKWISENLDQLLQNRWTRPELFRRNKSRGIAWLMLWTDPTVTTEIGTRGQIIFTIEQHHQTIQQTAWAEAGSPALTKGRFQ